MSEVAKIERIEPPQSTAITPMEMIDRAVQSGASVEALERLMALQERWEAGQGRKAYDAAISAAKAEIPPIIKNRVVDFTSQKGRTNYKHEDLAQIAATIDPILSSHGLSYRFRTTQSDGGVSVTCIISHRDGYSEETTLTGAPDQSGNKNSIQAVGSTVTYLQRYTLKSALGLAAAQDDDAKGAVLVKKINADQFFAIQGLVEETGADVPKLLQFLGAETLEELDLRQFDTAMSALRKKQAQKGGAQ
jgi:hypothetical protein